MNFGQALEAMKAGKRVFHNGWAPGEWIAVEGGDIIAHNDHSQPCLWRPGQACLLSDGWLVLKDAVKTGLSFGDAIKLLKDGKRIRRKSWDGDACLATYPGDRNIIQLWGDGKNHGMWFGVIASFEATDWQVVP